jgi:microcin C transport system permease protein
MAAYILKRLLLMLPTLLGVLLLTFVVIQFVPGGPVEQIPGRSQGGQRRRGGEGGASATAAARAWTQAHRADQGAVRLRQAAARALRADAGAVRPLRPGPQLLPEQGRLAADREKLPVSISLGLWTFFISYLIAVPLGVAKAVRAGSRFDLVTTLLVLVGYAIPGFVLGRRAAGGVRRPAAMVSAARPDVGQLGRAGLGAQASSTTCGTSRCRSRPWWWAASRSRPC